MSSNKLFRNREGVKGIKHTYPSPEVNHKSLISDKVKNLDLMYVLSELHTGHSI